MNVINIILEIVFKLGILVGSVWAVLQWRIEQRWRRLKFTQEMFCNIDADPVLLFAKTLLDYPDRDLRVPDALLALPDSNLQADPKIIEQKTENSKVFFLKHKWGYLPNALRVSYSDQSCRFLPSEICIRSAFDKLFICIENINALSKCSRFQTIIGSAPLDKNFVNFQTTWWVRLMCEIEDRFNQHFFLEYAKAWDFATAVSLFKQVRDMLEQEKIRSLPGYRELPKECGQSNN